MDHHEQAGPWRTLVQDEAFYRGLDAGIRFAVRVLHAAGIETHQSCEGGSGHCYDVPSVDFDGHPLSATGFAALAALAAYGLPVTSLSYYWSVEHGLPYENFWRVSFFRTMETRADEQPNPVHGYQFHGVPGEPER